MEGLEPTTPQHRTYMNVARMPVFLILILSDMNPEKYPPKMVPNPKTIMQMPTCRLFVSFDEVAGTKS